MDYKSMMGYGKKPKKKKVVKEQPKPKKNQILENVKKEINEWHHQPPTEKRWSGAFEAKDGLTEFERKGGKDNVNEGPAAEYAKEYQKVKHTYAQFWDAVQDFESLLKKKGLGRHAKEVDKQWKNNAEKFYKFFFKLIDRLM